MQRAGNDRASPPVPATARPTDDRTRMLFTTHRQNSIMVTRIRAWGFAVVMAASLCALSGCIGSPITETTYENDTLTLEIQNNGAPTDAILQVTIWRLDSLSQIRTAQAVTSVHLSQGLNTISTDIPLPPGQYRAFIQLFHGSERLGGVIREFDST